MGKSKIPPAALDHVLYEIEMLTQSFIALVQGPLPTLDTNVWIEIFAIHSRNLNEFFCKKDFGGAYMKPGHFVAWDYTYNFDPKLARRGSSQVAHLTYDREVPGEKTPWLVDEFFFPLREQCVQFLNQISQVDSLMSFQKNKARTSALIELLSKIRIKKA